MTSIYDEPTIRLLIFSILECNFQVSSSILNSFKRCDSLQDNKTLFDNNEFQNQIISEFNRMQNQNHFNNIYRIKDQFENKINTRSNTSIKEIQNIIEKFLKLYSSPTSTFNQIIFNHLYIISLQCNDSTLENIKIIDQIYQNHSIQITDVPLFLKTFYFIHKKSWVLSNYFISRIMKINTFINLEFSNLSNYSSYFQDQTKFSIDSINNTNFNQLFILLANHINTNNNTQVVIVDKEDRDSMEQFKLRFFFDIHYLINFQKGETIIEYLRSMDYSVLKKINYLGFLNQFHLKDGDDFSHEEDDAGGNNDLELIKTIVLLNCFKNRLLLEYFIEKSRLDLIQLILSQPTFKVKRVSEQLLLNVFGDSEFDKQYPIAEYLLVSHKYLIDASVTTSKFTLFTLPFLKSNLKLCKLLMVHYPTYIEIKIRHIKQNVVNGKIDILKYFYGIGSNILRSRIKRLLTKYSNESFDWLV